MMHTDKRRCAQIWNWLKVFLLVLALILPLAQSYAATKAASANSIQIQLIYPQKSNSAKRALPRKQESIVVSERVKIIVVGIPQEQLKHSGLFLEFYLDTELIYSTQDRQPALEFILETRSYPNGKHALVVNLWDPDGPSAIGIREIIIQNKDEDQARQVF